jgi:predicted transcriptional regulator
MSQKELALAALSRLSNDCTLEEIIAQIRFMAGVQEGIDQLDRGESVSHEEVKKNSTSWLSE